MQKSKITIISIVMIFANINKLISQELGIDEMYRIQLLVQMENYDSAIKFTKKLNDSLKCEKNEILGFSYGKLGKHDLAAKHYENYIKQCDASAIQRINLGDNYFKTNQLVKAKEQFLKVDEDDVNYSLAQYNVGIIEYDTGNKENAVDHFIAAINNTNEQTLDFDYLEILIKTLNEIKEYEKGFKNLDTVLSLWENNSTEYKYTLILRASIYGAMKKYKKAIKEIDNVLDLGIENKNLLFKAYAQQMEYYSKIKKTKKVCSVYQKIEDIDPKAEILSSYDCSE